MKVLKFGGTSVGSAASLQNVKRIVESQAEPVIVVVSALGGVTDELISISRTAETGDTTYTEPFETLKARHFEVVDTLLKDSPKYCGLVEEMGSLFGRLGEILRGISLLQILTERTSDEVVSFGERISSLIVAALIDGAVRFDALDFIRTHVQKGKNTPDIALTGEYVKQIFCNPPKVSVVPGFIARDSESGIITTLGRGGSDYTASIIAAALDAECLEIWTDVDGFMTADPRVIKTS